jgi:hypothetical protein
MQTKGVKSIVTIQPTDAAWYAAVAAVGAAIIGTGEAAAQVQQHLTIHCCTAA